MIFQVPPVMAAPRQAGQNNLLQFRFILSAIRKCFFKLYEKEFLLAISFSFSGRLFQREGRENRGKRDRKVVLDGGEKQSLFLRLIKCCMFPSMSHQHPIFTGITVQKKTRKLVDPEACGTKKMGTFYMICKFIQKKLF